jgi:hypothetical protein
MPFGKQGFEHGGTGGAGIAHQGEEKIREEMIRTKARHEFIHRIPERIGRKLFEFRMANALEV